jgi:hypothetical protein
MTSGILRDLAMAAEARRESNKQFPQAAKRLAKKIVETGRVGDRACVNDKVYAIENVAWTLMDKDGRTYETTPPVKTLAVHTGSWEMTLDGRVEDDRDMVSLLDLTAPGTDPVDSNPHYAGLVDILAAQLAGAYDIEGVGPTEFKPASNADYENFARDAEDLIVKFTKNFREEESRKRKEAARLDSLAAVSTQ